MVSHLTQKKQKAFYGMLKPFRKQFLLLWPYFLPLAPCSPQSHWPPCYSMDRYMSTLPVWGLCICCPKCLDLSSSDTHMACSLSSFMSDKLPSSHEAVSKFYFKYQCPPMSFSCFIFLYSTFHNLTCICLFHFPCLECKLSKFRDFDYTSCWKPCCPRMLSGT